MKKACFAVLIMTACLSQPVHAEGWLDSLKNLFGIESSDDSKASEQPSAQALLSVLTSNLNISEEQAKGGLGSIMQYAKQNANAETFSALSEQIPGLESLLSAVPDISNVQQDGISGLLTKAAEHSESLKAINDVKQQFEALGLSPDMIVSFIKQASVYLDTEQGQQAKALLSKALSGLNV